MRKKQAGVLLLLSILPDIKVFVWHFKKGVKLYWVRTAKVTNKVG